MSSLDAENANIDNPGLSVFSEAVQARNPLMRQCIALAEAAAFSPRPLMVTGESGAGKKLLSTLVHQRSPRRDRPFVCLPCAGLRSGELRSRLFGAGAPDKPPLPGALLDRCSGGTLVLQDVDQLDGALQNELLTLLKAYAGGTGDAGDDPGLGRKFGARLISTFTIVPGGANGVFLEELLFALGEITIRVPPLRQRREELDALIASALDQANRIHGKMIRDLSHSAREFVRHYDFPGNTRELFAMIDQAVRLGGRDAIYVEDLGLVNDADDSDAHVFSTGLLTSLEEMEKRHINKALLRTGWKKGAAARLLHISETMLNRKIRLYNLEHSR